MASAFLDALMFLLLVACVALLALVLHMIQDLRARTEYESAASELSSELTNFDATDVSVPHSPHATPRRLKSQYSAEVKYKPPPANA